MIQTQTETDPMLRRFERNQLAAGLCMAVAALLWGRWDVALGIVCGSALMMFSYRAIKGGVDLILPASAGASAAPTARRRWALAARFVGRYALLALAAYVMLVRLHMHPVGLLLGASCPMAAAIVELVRMARTRSRPGHAP
jgi:hypothetical protein